MRLGALGRAPPAHIYGATEFIMLRIRSHFSRHRAAYAVLLTVLAAVCMALSAYYFRPQGDALIHYRPTYGGPRDFYDPSAPWWFGAGTLALLAALWAARRPLWRARVLHPAPERAPRWALIALGALALWAVAEANGHVLELSQLAALSTRAQFALWMGGVALVGVGFAGTHWRALLSREVALLLALTALALVVRFWQLGGRVRVLVDEIHYVISVNICGADPQVALLAPMPTIASFPFLYACGERVLSATLGRDLLGLRALSAIMGALTVPAVYLLGRALSDRLTGWVAALVLLTFPPHVHYSRLALANIADPLFGTLALAGFAHALRSHRKRDWALGGLALGLSQYFYEGGRLLFPALSALWLGSGWLLWRPRPNWRHLVLAALVCALIAAPVYYVLWGVGFPFTDRLDKASDDAQYWQSGREPSGWGARWRHFKHALMLYVHAPENTLFRVYLYYDGHQPLILTWVVPFFLLGIAVALWHWRRAANLLLLWLLAVTVGNALLIESAVTARYVMAFPALALLIAFGVRVPLTLLWPRGREWRWQVALTLLLAAGIAAGQFVYYFGDHLRTFEATVYESFQYDAYDALWRTADFPAGTHVYLVADRLPLTQSDAQHVADYLTDNLHVEIWSEDALTPLRLLTLRRDVDLAFFVPPYNAELLARLGRTFGAQSLSFSPYGDVPPEKALVLFYVPQR